MCDCAIYSDAVGNAFDVDDAGAGAGADLYADCWTGIACL